jgi:hypothetical protein
MSTQSPPKHRKVKGVVALLEKYGIDADEIRWESYSGDYMFGRTSPLAFIAPFYPDGEVGKTLRKRGFSADNMGKQFVYYLYR